MTAINLRPINQFNQLRKKFFKISVLPGDCIGTEIVA